MKNSLSVDQFISVLKEPASVKGLTIAQWEPLLFVLKTSRLEAYLAFTLHGSDIWCDLPAKVRHHLSAAMVYAQRQSEQVNHEGLEIHELLTAQGITPVFLKGAAYIVAQTINAKGRLCSDIDLLVKQDTLSVSERTLLDNFWYHKSITDYDDKYYREYAHEIPPLYHLTRGTVLDLHHNLFLPISGKAPPLEQFWAGITCHDNGLYTLAPPAMFMHSVIHLMLNEEVVYGFRDIIDLKCLAEQYGDELFWQEVSTFARQSQFDKELNVVITLLNRWFDTGISLPSDSRSGDSFRLSLLTQIYKYALIPEHPVLNSARFKLARFLVFIRGHSIKMPARILIKHFSIKMWLGIRNWVRGDKTADAKPVDLGRAFKR